MLSTLLFASTLLPGARVSLTALPPLARTAPPILVASSPTARRVPEPLLPLAPTATFLVLHEVLCRSTLRAGIKFPPTIIGMVGGFVILCLLPRKTSKRLEEWFDPANRLLRDWIAATFSPGFAVLPITMPVVAAADLGVFLLLAAAGFVVTVGTTAGIATALTPRRLSASAAGRTDMEDTDLSTPDAGPPPPPPNPFPPVQQAVLVGGALLAAIAHVLGWGGTLTLNAALLCTTLGSFSLATTLCPPAVKVVLHPFVTCSLCTVGGSALLGAATGLGWRGALGVYKAGAGRLLGALMGPTVLSFAFQLYRYRAQLRRRGVQIVGTALSGSFVGMLTTAVAVRVCRLGSPALRLALISRSTTTAFAVEVCKLLGAEPPSLGLLAAFVTGLLAFPFGKAVLGAFGVTDPAVRGLALGGTAHGGGLLTLSDEPEAFPFAAVMMNMAGVCAVCLVSAPPLRKLLVSIALG